MVSTRRKSYQPTAAVTPDGAPVAGRQRHSSLTSPPATADPSPAPGPRRRRTTSLTSLADDEAAAETGQTRPHRTKALLERYRSEAGGALTAVAEEAAQGAAAAAETAGVRSEGVRCEPVPAAEADMEVEVEKETAAQRLAAAQRVLASVTEAAAPAPSAADALQSLAGLTRVRAAPVPRGQPKSGRFWKPVRSKASKVLVRDPVSYEVRMQKRQQLRVVKDLENQLKSERKQKLEELRKRREYNVKKTAENALKAEVYQTIKNPNKIKRMKKKQLRLLQKRDTTVVGKSVLDE